MNTSSYNYNPEAVKWCDGLTLDQSIEVYGTSQAAMEHYLLYDDTGELHYLYPDGAESYSCCQRVLHGCVDPNALNYDVWANTDDGSCQYEEDIVGCMDPTMFNYDPTATVQCDDCCIKVIPGCMDASALNYVEPTGDVNGDVNTPCDDCCEYASTITLEVKEYNNDPDYPNPNTDNDGAN